MGQISATVEIMEQKVGVESVEQHSIWLRKEKPKNHNKKPTKQKPNPKPTNPTPQQQINAAKTCDIKLHLKKNVKEKS